MAVPIRDLRSRFEKKFTALGPDECWPWLGPKKANGYGYMYKRMDDGRYKSVGAHRLAIIFSSGRDEPDLLCCHECDNPICVNPAHLTWGTQTYNMQGAKERGRTRYVLPVYRDPATLPRGEDHPHSILSEQDVRYIYDQAAAGRSASDIAREMQRPWQTVAGIIAGRSWAHMLDTPGAPTVAEMRAAQTHPMAKLTKTDVEAIRSALASGEAGRRIAKRFGVSPATVSNIKNRKGWV